jgi:hypothetical protein
LMEQDHKESVPKRFKPLPWALRVYLILIPVAYLVASISPGSKNFPFYFFVAVMHALMCAVVAAICKAVAEVVDAWLPRSRLRPYTGDIRNFVALLAIWPFCIAIIMIIKTYKAHG